MAAQSLYATCGTNQARPVFFRTTMTMDTKTTKGHCPDFHPHLKRFVPD